MKFRQRVRDAGFGHLVDDFNLVSAGIVSLRRPVQLTRPTVLAPCSVAPAPSSTPHVRLTPQEHRDLITAMFGDQS